ncbi:TonB-dependent siderophore receptor [Sphingomonas albertensis]|uniref:TonB-dependent receptor n=1 Tax=Sphingomonas albertensis TaxID=2762591 RepID=A0ABR7ALV4_9SPHN|nr:TonB-dependent receptor [Sphingomonas albertensis]MBC3941428.1 TonB-dependent receptor [Sphingomonas albertensis]
MKRILIVSTGIATIWTCAAQAQSVPAAKDTLPTGATQAATVSGPRDNQPQPDSNIGAGSTDMQSSAGDGDIVVTGSRIARPELQSAMPVSVIRAEEAKTFARTTVYDALLLTPAVGPGVGETNSGGQVFDQGVANINLRNLGTNRSLVLVDGKRWVSGGARTSAVDLNTIPTALIDRYEIVTGGAAAIYGADAVSGAVNIIMKKKLSGVELSVTNGISERGDGRQTNATLATGFAFGGDRGHVVIGGEYNDTTPIENLSRYPKRISYYPNPASKGPNDGIPDNILNKDTRNFSRAAVPTFCLPAGAGCQQWYQVINDVVTAVPQDSYRPVITGPIGTQEGGTDTGSTSFENVLLRAKSQRAAAYTNLSYELTPAVTWNGTFSYAHTYTEATPVWPANRSDSRASWWAGAGGEVATLNNPYLPSSLRDFMVGNGLTSIPLARTYLNLPRSYEIHKRDNFTLGTDLSAKLTDKFTLQGFVRYGQVVDNITTTNMIVKDNWLAGRNSMRDASGQIVCSDPAARAAGCVPIDFVSTEPFSQAALNYIERDRYDRTKNSLLNAGGSVSGSAFSLPYGDLSFAAGLEWRREKLSTRDDPDTAKLNSIIWAGGLDYQLHPALDAKRDTSELFAETLIPVLADLPFAKRVEVEGAYRYSHYSDNPDTHTWKAGATWEPFSGLTLRGVYSHSVRVPNFGELFSPLSSVTFGGIDDPCQTGLIAQNTNRAANCAALVKGVALPLPRPNLSQPVIVSGGNPNLTPERSNSYTLGAVFQPKVIRGLDATVDYFNIKIDNVITALPYLTLLNNCVDSPGGPDQSFCQFITRDARGEVTSVRSQFANLAKRSSQGIDVGINYRKSLGRGILSNRLSGTYLLDQTIVSAVGRPGVDYAGEWDFPKIRGTLFSDYTIGMFSIGLLTRFIGRSTYDVTAASNETFDVSHIPAFVYNDVTLSFRPSKRHSISVGVKNISDAQVPLILRGNTVSPNSPSFRQDGGANYDAIGRYFFVRVGANF